MQDEERDNIGHNEEAEGGELPASVIFMEMMRRAAASQNPRPVPPPAPKPPIVRHQAAPASAEPLPPAMQPVQPVVQPLPPAPPTPAEVDTVNALPDAVSDSAEMPPAPVLPARPPMTEEERRQAAALEAQRIQRVQRRQKKRRARGVGILGGLVRTFMVVLVSAGLMATILSWWTNSDFLRPEMRRTLQVALATDQFATPVPAFVPTPNWLRTIGIVSGHRGPGQQAAYDPGAVCPDGLTENEINFNVATRVVDNLRQRGYRAELLEEFDARLDNYQAEALLSIHANTCQEFPGGASGFIVAKAAARAEDGQDTRLAECIAAYYGPMTGLERRFSLTVDMTDYHTFREIHPLTPAAIIELGFMRDDRELLTGQPDLLAAALVEGILCFIDPENVPAIPRSMEATPAPTTDTGQSLENAARVS